MELGYILCVLVLAVVLWYIGAPLIMGVRAGSILSDASAKHLLDLALRKEEVMLTIKDLELDYRMKKISEADHQALHAESVKQGVQLIQQMESTQKTPSAQAGGKFCTECGCALMASAKFCGECGHKIVRASS